MKAPVLDLRRPAARAAETRWERWEDAPPRGSAPLRALTDALVRSGARRRAGRRPAPPERPLLVSVGNLRVGGTGKTPLVRDLARRLGARGLRGAVLVRGYGSPEPGPLRVDPANARCGDEARLLAGDLPDWTVVQARHRHAGLAHLLAADAPPEVVLLEDAHQTAGLPRHLDLLILDRWSVSGGGLVPETGRLIPWGPYREDAGGADRADALVVVLDASAPAPPERTVDGRPVLACRRHLAAPEDWPAEPGPTALLSGVARPERFESDAARALGLEPVLRVRCDDHAAYDAALLERLLAAGAEAGATRWLTTAKDRVKLWGAWPQDAPPLHAAGLELDWTGAATPADLVAARLEDLP